MATASPLIPPPDDAWDEEDWRTLMDAIQYQECTPFLGAGVSYGVLPLGNDLAQQLAREHNYPFADNDNLSKVTQYLAVEFSPKTPRYRVVEKLNKCGKPDFTDASEPHRVLADLELPVYITTNYDDFMTRALERDLPKRTPKRLMCNWHTARARKLSLQEPNPDPNPENPVVFHLHGRLDDLDSMVLTEDDYLDFLMYISEERDLIPPRIEQAFSDSTLLFMGYSLQDINFKVIFRKLAAYIHRSEGPRHVSVQLPIDKNLPTEQQIIQARKQQQHLEKLFGLQKVKIYWGSCHQFAADLRKHWEARRGTN